MKILIAAPGLYMSPAFDDMIFAPRELIVNLADGLVDRGHDVTLATSPDTKTKAKVLPGDSAFLSQYIKTRGPWLKRDYEIDLTSRAIEFANEHHVDVISSHKDITHYFEKFTNVPIVYTLHDAVGSIVTQKFADHRFIAISQSQKSTYVGYNVVGVVHHGLNLSDYPFAGGQKYLLFMGRLVPEKGLHTAIRAAIAANAPIAIGTDFPSEDAESTYYKSEIKPHLDNPLIHEPGFVKNDKKFVLYQNAKALLFPIEWDEPFGMVMIEAMACGTPVIAFNRGSVPEIVKDGITGFIIDHDLPNFPYHPDLVIKKRGVDGLVEAIKRIGELDRAACRRHVEEHFTVSTMVEGYEKVYQKVLNGK